MTLGPWTKSMLVLNYIYGREAFVLTGRDSLGHLYGNTHSAFIQESSQQFEMRVAT